MRLYYLFNKKNKPDDIKKSVYYHQHKYFAGGCFDTSDFIGDAIFFKSKRMAESMVTFANGGWCPHDFAVRSIDSDVLLKKKNVLNIEFYQGD